MKKKRDLKTPISQLHRYFKILITLWLIIISASLSWNFLTENRRIRREAINKARENFNKDVAFRFWATSHGGVYVPVTEQTPPNEYLSNVLERDITTPSGKKLTLMNPAYMLRQLMSKFPVEYGITGRITSLNPIRSGNAPDEWERKALQQFEGTGITEITEFIMGDDVPTLRFMSALKTEEGCLKCHAQQGYKVGDIRGGIGITVAMGPFIQEAKHNIFLYSVSHGILLLAGIVVILLNFRRLKKDIEEKAKTELDLFIKNKAIESAMNGVAISDIDGILSYINPAFLSLWGYLNGSEIIGKSLLKFWKDPVKAGEVFAKLLQENNWSGEMEGIRKNGEIFLAQIFASRIRDESGQTTNLMAFFDDITQKKLNEKKIQSSLEEKEILLRELYHRTKNNMQVIRSLLALQAENINNEEVKKVFLETENRILSMSLVHQKLYQSNNLSCIKIDEYIQNLSEELLQSYNLTEKNITFTFHMESVPMVIDMAIPCGLILNELISNSLKYAFPDNRSGNITISLKKLNKEMLQLIYEDNGIGIAENFDHHNSKTLGMQTIFAIGEHQLGGKVEFLSREVPFSGILFRIEFSLLAYQ